jgi:hypothetical protein
MNPDSNFKTLFIDLGKNTSQMPQETQRCRISKPLHASERLFIANIFKINTR